MEGKYFKLSLREKDVYFRIEIQKYNAYSAHGIDFQDYQVIIMDLDIWEPKMDFEDIYGGLFLYLDENKKIRIYDNIKKKFIDIENNKDINHFCYFYCEKKYFLSLENVIKEIIYEQFIE